MECSDGRNDHRGRSGYVSSAAQAGLVASNQDGGLMVCGELLSDLNKDCLETLKPVPTDWKNSSSPSLHVKQMEDTPRLNFQIPRKSKEKRALFQYVSLGSREYTDISKIITSGYKDPSSWGSYQYTKHCLVHSELQEKDFVEKRRELKMEGRSEKEMVESYCFFLCESYKLQSICDKGLHVGHSWMNLLGNPAKGVYLCKYSDLLQINPFEPGVTGDIVIFKVIKGKMKSIYDNMSRSLDPTPKFDSHISKSFSRVASHRSYRAFEHTQQYFYEYDDIDVRTRPRHICPYAVVTFRFKGKESATLTKPMPLLRSNSFRSGKEKSSYDVWSGALTNGGKEVYHVSFRSLSQPILPFKLPDKIEIGTVMHLEQVKLKIPPTLFSWDLYSGSQEVCKKGTHCCLFEVVEKNKYGNSLTVLLYKLEREKLVLVNAVTDRGFFFLLSSAQMANPSERRDGWKGSNLQALFVFPESRDVAKCSLKPTSSPSVLQPPQHSVLPHLGMFIPALHFALNKVRCTPQTTPPANPSIAVEQQLSDFLSGQREGKLLPRVHIDYDHKLDDRERLFPAPRNKLNLEAYLQSYICCPNLYCIPVAKAQVMMDTPPKLQECCTASNQELAVDGSRFSGAGVDKDPEKVQQLLELIQIQKQQAAKGSEAPPAMTVKRKREDEAEVVRGKCARKSTLNNGNPTADDGLQTASPLAEVLSLVGRLCDTDLRKNKTEDDSLQTASSLAEVMSLAGLCDTDLRKNKTEGALKLMEMLDTINQTATVASTSPTFDGGMETEVVEEESEQPYETLEDSRVKLGLPINCDIDLRKQFVDKEDTDGADFEVESVGSMSSLEAFSPYSDHGHQRGTNLLGEKSIPWVLIPITGIKHGGYSQRQWDNPQDPRSVHSTTDSLQPHHDTDPATKLDPVTGFEEPPQPETEEPLKEAMEEPTKAEGSAEKDLNAEETFSEEEKNLTDKLKPSHCQAYHVQSRNVVDSIVDEQLTDFSAGVMSLLKRKHVSYWPPPAWPPPPSQLRTHVRPFSDYVSRHHDPVPLYGFVRTLRSSLTSYIDSHLRVAVPELPAQASSLHSSSSPDSSPSTVLAPASCSSVSNSSNSLSRPSVGSLPVLHAPPSLGHLSSSQTSTHLQSLPRPSACKETIQPPQDHCLRLSEGGPNECTEQEAEEVFSGSCTRASTPLPSDDTDSSPAETSPAAVDETTESSGGGDPSPSSLTNLINQLNPEMFSNLVEIIKGVRKNSVQFYIHSGDAEDNKVCSDIKEYLLRLGNAESNPQLFLENSSDADKLFIIIRNEDIASEIHKIPALVKLKKLPFVSFAGVDSLDDVRNNTYNELFVSGGFIVSDEFVLNPDFTTWERLQMLLEFLQQVNTPETPWRWKVHCKTLKRLREQSRVKGDAFGLLNLLTAYQKRHVVEFLPYHECDAPGNSSNDLACLVKLQAQHTQHRHVIFLTEFHFEKFQHYASSGILIATIDDVINNLNNLSGFHDGQPKVPLLQNHSGTSLVTLPEHKNEGLALASKESLLGINLASCGNTDERHSAPPDSSQPSPDQLVPDGGKSLSRPSPVTAISQELDLDALRVAMSKFKAATAGTDSTSKGHFNVITHQSYLGVGLPPGLCTNASESVNSPTTSLLAVNTTQTSSTVESQVDCLLKEIRSSTHSTHPSPSQDIRSTQQVQETTVTTSSQDYSTPTSPRDHTIVNCQDSSPGLESLMGSHTLCDNVLPFGITNQSLTNTTTFLQSESVCGMAQDNMATVTSGISDTNFKETIKTKRTSPDSLDGCNRPLPNPPTVTEANNVSTHKPEGKSFPTSTVNTVSSIALKQELVESPLPLLQSKQPEESSTYGGNALTVHPDDSPHPSTASVSKNDSTPQQAAGIWPYPQGPMLMSSLGHGINTTTTDPRAAMMFQHVMGNGFGNRLGGLTPRSNLMPIPGVPMVPITWSGYSRGSASTGMWGMQQSLQFRPMHQTQFIQGFTWRSGYPGQGNGYRP
ncbi:hypothetical protein ACEWY4_013905 [Coilia grayii]|uniref:DUF3715 domain-containing protein n=1 Tax=Coilia grayii TaxID=363190 RepID=A0ABD1JXQ7_9TELE